jgi:hypothetical protein
LDVAFATTAVVSAAGVLCARSLEAEQATDPADKQLQHPAARDDGEGLGQSIKAERVHG